MSTRRRRPKYDWERPPKRRSLSKLELGAYRRHARDLRTGHERGLWFDDESAERAVRFVETYCQHTVGRWAGDVFRLVDWQEFVVRCIFGWRRADGTRRFRLVYLQMARKQGKTTLLAAIGLFLLVADFEVGAQVYSVATKRDQAKLVFLEACRMVRRGDLDEWVEVIGGRAQSKTDCLSCAELESYWLPLAADEETLDGLNPHGVLADELHAWKVPELWEVLETSVGAREQPLIFAITTPGAGRDGVCFALRQHAGRMLERVVDDDNLFAFICEPGHKADWKSEATWEQGNPSIDITVQRDDLRAKATQAGEIPSQQTSFRRLRVGQWTEQLERAIPAELWDRCAAEWDPAILVGRPCYGGLDLASTTDVVAYELVFPPLSGEVEERPWWYVLTWAWVPEEGLLTRSYRERVPLLTWRDAGLLQVTSGDEVDYQAVRHVIQTTAELYDLREVGYDPWNAGKLVQELSAEDGITMVKISQGMGGMSAATKETLRLLRKRQLLHGNHPVLSWHAANLALYEDSNANVKPSRKSSAGRIDCMVAMIMAIDRASRAVESDNVYDRDDVGLQVI